ncbi:hypothetical protein HMI56_002938, partial [Coelomomyces lativittatus]
MNVVYCSNADAMNSTWNTPLTSNFPTATSKDIRGLLPNQLTNLTNYLISPALSSTGGQPLAAKVLPCVYWDRRDYPFSPVYERDPFANMDNANIAAALNSPAGAAIKQIARMSSTFIPDIKYGWLNLYSANYSNVLLELTTRQLYPWAIIKEPPGVSLGERPKIDPVSFEAAVGRASGNPSASGFLGAFPDMYFLKTNVSRSQGMTGSSFQPIPYFDKYSSSEALSESNLDSIFYQVIQNTVDELGSINKAVLFSSTPNVLDQLAYNSNISYITTKVPWAGIIFTKFEPSSNTYTYLLQAGSDKRILNAGSYPSEGFRRFWLSCMISNAILQTKNSATISHGLRAMPQPKSTELNLPIGSYLGRILYPFGVSFLMPIFILILVKEKEERILVMMKMNGLSSPIYYFAHYVHFFLMHILASVVFIISGSALKLELFTQTAPLVYIILFFVWGNAQIALSFFLSVFFSKSRNALAVSFLLVLLAVIVNIAATNLFSNNAPWFYFCWPPFAFYRALLILNAASVSTRQPAYKLSTLANEGDEVFISIIAQVIAFFVYFILAYYLSQVLPSEYGVRKPWHFILSEPWGKLRGKADRQRTEDEKNLEEALKEDETQFEDADVKAERARVDSNNISPTCPLIIRHMRKIYPGTKKVAVKDITFAVEQDNIFGLLGPNGAGKTSLISILTGLYPPTAGTAHIGGFNIYTEQDDVHHLVGICPQ